MFVYVFSPLLKKVNLKNKKEDMSTRRWDDLEDHDAFHAHGSRTKQEDSKKRRRSRVIEDDDDLEKTDQEDDCLLPQHRRSRQEQQLQLIDSLNRKNRRLQNALDLRTEERDVAYKVLASIFRRVDQARSSVRSDKGHAARFLDDECDEDEDEDEEEEDDDDEEDEDEDDEEDDF